MHKVFNQAGLIVCLFLCAHNGVFAVDHQWKFDPVTSQAYGLVLNLQFDKAHELVPQPLTAQENYVAALAEALELLLEEDGEKYTEYQERFEKRKERKTRVNSPDDLFLQAEIAVQWAFIYFKFGHEFDAALNLRDAYIITTELEKRFPRYAATNKTSALLEIIVGAVPEKYNWVLSLLNIEGSIEEGLQLYERIGKSDSPFKLEAAMLKALIQSYVLQKPIEGLHALDTILAETPTNPLALFLGASLAIKNSESQKALNMLNILEAQPTGFRIDYVPYLKGEVFLFKAEYLNSISSYRAFINQYKGQNNIKDAYYKIGICYWLNGNMSDALAMFKLGKTMGREVTEGDKYAARSMSDAELPHPQLTKARYFTDGGYYDQARAILDSIVPPDLPTKRDQVEFYYRKARLDHKTNRLTPSRHFYQQVIDLNGQSPWYFAPNACLQMGYILLQTGDSTRAGDFFEMALSYKKHEYKNSIDTKARSALAQLKRR